MGFEEDRQQNAEGFSWEFEPNAIERRNRIMRAQEERAKQVRETWEWKNNVWSSPPGLNPQMLKTVGVALLVIAAIVFLLLLAPIGGCQELPRLPAFEKQFVWAQMTWSKSQNQWCIDAQPMGAGPGELVGACAETLQDAKRAVMSDGAEVLPITEQPSGQTDPRPDYSADNRPDMPEPHIEAIAPLIGSQGHTNESYGLSRTHYWDRENVILSSSMVAVGSFDLAQTCHSIANGGREVWMPMKTCGSLVGVGVAMGLGMTYLSYQLHRHGHHRLERIPFIGMIAGNTAGITFSHLNGAW